MGSLHLFPAFVGRFGYACNSDDFLPIVSELDSAVDEYHYVFLEQVSPVILIFGSLLDCGVHLLPLLDGFCQYQCIVSRMVGLFMMMLLLIF
jgi:hypothetical protein